MSAIQRFISDSRVVAIFGREWPEWGKCGENRQNKNRLIRYYQQIKRFFLYPESNKTTCDGGSSVNRTRPDTDNEIIAGGGQVTRLLEKLQRYTATGPTPPAGTNSAAAAATRWARSPTTRRPTDRTATSTPRAWRPGFTENRPTDNGPCVRRTSAHLCRKLFLSPEGNLHAR